VRSDISGSFAVDLTMFKNHLAAAEDKVDVTLDVTVFEKLPATVDEQRVLPPEKAAILKHHPISISQKRDCL